jgi:carbon-monoxide dehydrogenase medium subunit
MKAAAFEHARPESLDAAIDMLTGSGGARVLAGGQSLGPMLNLRLARPELLVQVNRLPELAVIAADAESVTIGACVTHAAIADGAVPDIGHDVPFRHDVVIGHDSLIGQEVLVGQEVLIRQDLLRRVANGIAYRAVRNRGTIGGSLCHADPAADWVIVLTALGASVVLRGPHGQRHLTVADFILGAFRTALAPGEILRAVRVPRLPPDARWGYVKACRKPGDFAHAMAAVLLTPRARRLVLGALDGKPLLLENDAVSDDGVTQALAAMVEPDDARRRMRLVTARRALVAAKA